MPLTHYHLKLYHDGRFLKEAEQINDRHSATIRAQELTQQVQRQAGAATYVVRAEPCTLVHFPPVRGSA